jgi:hypothetical protein
MYYFRGRSVTKLDKPDHNLQASEDHLGFQLLLLFPTLPPHAQLSGHD